MKRRMIQALSIAALTLLFTGCGSRENAASPAETAQTEVQTAQEAVAETEAPASEAPETSTQETAAIETEAATEPTVSENTQNTLLTEEEAKVIALEDAGVTEQEILGIRVKLEQDDGIQEYEVDFYAGNTEYDYDIDAMTGEIRSKDMDIDDDFSHREATGSAITEEEAKALALSKVPEASESNIHIKQDYDDGRLVYEGSIICNNKEYEFEIDAESGKIIAWEEE